MYGKSRLTTWKKNSIWIKEKIITEEIKTYKINIEYTEESEILVEAASEEAAITIVKEECTPHLGEFKILSIEEFQFPISDNRHLN